MKRKRLKQIFEFVFDDDRAMLIDEFRKAPCFSRIYLIEGRLYADGLDGTGCTQRMVDMYAWFAVRRLGLEGKILRCMYAEGLSCGDIAYQVSMSKKTIYDLMRNHGIARRSPGEGARIKREYLRTLNFDSDAERYVARELDELGISYDRRRLYYYAGEGEERCRHYTTPDFIFDDSGVLLYIDGFHHRLPDSVERDRRQDKGLSAEGWTVVRTPANRLDYASG